MREGGKTAFACFTKIIACIGGTRSVVELIFEILTFVCPIRVYKIFTCAVEAKLVLLGF